MKIVLKDIPGIVEKYQAGSDGFIYSHCGKSKVPKKLKPCDGSKGPYSHVSIVDSSGKRKSADIHVLVCKAFKGEGFGNSTVAHIDGDPTNNTPSNLIWKPTVDNHKDKFIHGTHDSGTNNSRAFFDDDGLFVVRWLLNNTNLSHQKISDIMGCERLTITKIKNGQRYGNIQTNVVSSVIDSVMTDALKTASKY